MKDTKHIRRDFHFFAWVMSQGRDFRGLGCQGRQNIFSNMVIWHIKSTGMTSRTKDKYNVHPRVKMVSLVRSKGQISLNFGYHVNFKEIVYQTLCVFSQIKDRK